MSSAAAATRPAQSGRVAQASARRNRLNPLEALERGFSLFKSTFATEGWRYYAGATPLVLCLIPLWVLDGQIRVSAGGLLLESLLLAGAYVLRVCMVADYMERVRERAFGVRVSRATRAARLAGVGRLLAWKITLSAAAVVALVSFAGPSWFYGASQFASLEARQGGDERHSVGGCMGLSTQWFGGGLLLFPMLIPLWGAVWLNGFLVAIIVPQLLHSILGVSTLLSTQMGIFSLIQSSAFWLSLSAGAWLALDPIVKCTFIVVYQHLRSRTEGDDLRGLIASLPRNEQKKAEMMGAVVAGRAAKVGALLAIAAILYGAPAARGARVTRDAKYQTAVEPAATDSTREARVQKLRVAVTEESRREIYRWHDAEHPSQPTWLDKLLAKIGHVIELAWNEFWKLMHELWPNGLNLSLGNGKGGSWRLKDLRVWLALIAALALAAGGALFWLRRRREPAEHSVPMAAAPLPDLSDAAIASEKSEDEWFALANRLEGEGELRLALRAAYLGLLAGLSQREWLTIRRDRTNREYLDEFTRRWRRRPQAAIEARAEVPEKLRGSLRLFDRVWYGSYAVTHAAVAAYRQEQRELLSHV